MLRRPPLLQKDAPAVSRKLQPRARLEAFAIKKQAGPNSFILADIASGAECTSFHQPVHADRLVPMEVPELAEPIDEALNLVIEGRRGTVERQALDGWVLIRLDTAAREDEFAEEFRRLGAKRDAEARGVWVDLQRFAHDFR